MSRRSSRYSLDGRENDALFEFENFKKKFLVANKHITKLNSTLSVRVEELNAQVAFLQAENLRLRQSELAMSRQLKSERDKSRHIMLNAENAVHALTKHFGTMRAKFDIPYSTPPSSPPKKSSPKAKRPPSRGYSDNVAPTGSSPPRDRLAKIPVEPDIVEDDEPLEEPPSPSRLRTDIPACPPGGEWSHPRVQPPPAGPPLPLLTPSTAFLETPVPDLSAPSLQKKKKPTRRQSGIFSLADNAPSSSLQTSEPPRPSSPCPMFGSPVKNTKHMLPHVHDDDDEFSHPAPLAVKPKDKKKHPSLASDPTLTGHPEILDSVGRGRKMSREPGRKLKDVTNSPHRKAASSSIRADENAEPPPPIPSLPDPASHHTPLPHSCPSVPIPIPKKHADRFETEPPLLPSNSQPDAPVPSSSRSTRARKSVNYAEPKLNTKMRKPDPTPEELAKMEKRKIKRSSAAAALPSTSKVSDITPAPEKPRSTRSLPPPTNDDDDDGKSPSCSTSSSKRSSPSEGTHSPSSLPLPPSPPRRKALPSRQISYYSYRNNNASSGSDDGEEADEEYVPARTSTKDRKRKALGSTSGRSEW